jgi:hypothetical protein
MQRFLSYRLSPEAVQAAPVDRCHGGQPFFSSFFGSFELNRKPRANRLRCFRLSMPSVQDCYERANSCLNDWNLSDDNTGRSWLLRTADAWLQLASELKRNATQS